MSRLRTFPECLDFDTTPGLGSSPLTGIAGLLFSPYASIFLYSPIVVLAFFGLRALWRRDRGVAGLFVVLVLAAFAVVAGTLLVHGTTLPWLVRRLGLWLAVHEAGDVALGLRASGQAHGDEQPARGDSPAGVHSLEIALHHFDLLLYP